VSGRLFFSAARRVEPRNPCGAARRAAISDQRLSSPFAKSRPDTDRRTASLGAAADGVCYFGPHFSRPERIRTAQNYVAGIKKLGRLSSARPHLMTVVVHQRVVL